MRITIIGMGYVGLVSGACFAELGFDVTCVDKDSNKIKTLQNYRLPIFEPGLCDYLGRNIRKGRLHFTTQLKDSIITSDVIFITIGTPYDAETNNTDLTPIFSLLEEAAPFLVDYKVIVIKSTVPIGTTKKIKEYLQNINQKADFDIVANPEFLKEGSAIQDFIKPDRIVIGTESLKAKKIMKLLYHSFILTGIPIIDTNLETAELIKYASNAFLATKITFINQIADLCEKCNGDVRQVAEGMGLDNRIGKEFLNVGPGFGGSCFPKDIQALVHTSNHINTPLTIVKAVQKYNYHRKYEMANRIISMMGGNIQGKNISILGLTFKANTDDLRESPSLTIIPLLHSAGAKITAYDPKASQAAKELFSNITLTKTAYEAIKDADALVILTEWEEFKLLDLREVKKLLKSPLIIDLRNIFSFSQMNAHGFMYHSLGHSPLLPLNSQKAQVAGL